MIATSGTLLQSIRGPLMLITFGALLAVDHTVSGLSFWRTWPLLFIVYGALKLVERLGPRVDYYVPTPPTPPPAPPRRPS